MKKRWLRQAGWVGGILLLSASPLVIQHCLGKRALRGAEAELRAKGEKLTVAELAPARVDPTSNGLWMLLSATGRIPRVNPPPNRFAAPGRLIVATTMESWPGFSRTNLTTWEEIEGWHAQAEAGLVELRQALGKPAFDAQLDYSRGFEILLPHLSAWKRAAQALSTTALAELRDGDRAATLGYLRDACQLDRVARHEPLLISQLVRIAVDTIALNTIWHCLHATNWTEAELAGLQSFLPPPTRPDDMVRALEMERGLMGGALNQMRLGKRGIFDWTGIGFWAPQAPTKVSEFFDVVVERPGEVLLAPAGNLAWRYSFLDGAEAHYLRTSQRMIEFARGASRQRAASAYEVGLIARESEAASRIDRFRYVLSYSALAAMDLPFHKAMKLETHQCLVQTAIALHRHRLKHGAWPEDLSVLIPEFLRAAPVDYMDGKPIRYRRNAEGDFVLYSVGQLLSNSVAYRDDGGDPFPPWTNSSSFSLWDGKDAVWPRPATAEEAAGFHRREAEKRKRGGH